MNTKITNSITQQIQKQIDAIEELLLHDAEFRSWQRKTEQILENMGLKVYVRAFKKIDFRNPSMRLIGSDYDSSDNDDIFNMINPDALKEAKQILLEALQSTIESKEFISKRRKKEKRIIYRIPKDVIRHIPKKIQTIINELNTNIKNNCWHGSALLIRKIIDMSIHKKCLIEGKDDILRNKDKEYYRLEKKLNICAENKIIDCEIVKKIKPYKWLTDSAAHSFRIRINYKDIEGSTIVLRLFLEEIFK